MKNLPRDFYRHVLTDHLIVRPTDPPDSVLAAYVRDDRPKPKPPMSTRQVVVVMESREREQDLELDLELAYR